MLVIPKYPYNHPQHPHAKPTLEEKELLEKCTKASRAARITPKALRDSALTAEVLGGQKCEEALPSIIDNPCLQCLIKGLNQTRYTKGLNWDSKSSGTWAVIYILGVVYKNDNLEALLPANKQYIHCASSKSNIWLVVAMLWSSSSIFTVFDILQLIIHLNEFAVNLMSGKSLHSLTDMNPVSQILLHPLRSWSWLNIPRCVTGKLILQ